jgi:hypothetical protein
MNFAMRAWLRLLVVGLLASGCVDLSRPPELDRPAVTPGPDDAAAPAPADASVGGGDRPLLATPDVGTLADAAIPDEPSVTAPDAATLPADGPPSLDAAQVPDAAVPADAPPPPDTAVPPVAAPDAAVPADAPVPVDAPPPPDAAPDAPVPRDLAPDLAPDAGPDTAPPLIIDDFQTAPQVNRNNLGSVTSSDHQVCNRVSGEMICTYAGSGGFQDFIETLNNWCAYDARAYSKVRFRLRASVAGEMVDVYVGLGTGCTQQLPNVLLGRVVTTTTMTTYEFSLGAIARERLVLFELDPKSTNTTQFILDDFQLVP